MPSELDVLARELLPGVLGEGRNTDPSVTVADSRVRAPKQAMPLHGEASEAGA